MTKYVCGFMFTADRRHMVLIEKQKPTWQAGRFNGVGGKIEPGEQPLAAMVREFVEEAGVLHPDWEEVAVLSGDGFEVHFFAAFTDRATDATTMESEEVFMWPVGLALADERTMPNLRVMIPLALDTSGIVKPVALADRVPQ